MEIAALAVLFVFFAAMGILLGRSRTRSARDAHDDAGIEFPLKYASGLADSWRAFRSRSKVITSEGTIVRLDGGQVLIHGPDRFGRLRQRWFTLAAGVTVPAHVGQGDWVRIEHSGGVVITITSDRDSPHGEGM